MIEIKKATAQDAENILEYCKLVGGETDNLTFGSEGISISLEQEKEYLESILQSNNQLYLVAVKDGEVVGTSNFTTYAKTRLAHRGEIGITVKKSMWGKHIGTRLLEEIIRFVRECTNIEIISLEVRSDNTRAIALYKKFGFDKVGTFKGFMKINGSKIDCDIMQLYVNRHK